jgi:hypothetical protein
MSEQTRRDLIAEAMRRYRWTRDDYFQRVAEALRDA